MSGRSSTWRAALAGCRRWCRRGRDANALGPIDIEVAARAGYGTNPSNVGPVRGTDGVSSVGGIANALSFGVGGRVGASFSRIYTGVKLEYYVGESGQIGTIGSGAGRNIGGTAHTLTFGAELGYDFRLARYLTIRPQIGIGNADHQSDVVSGLACDTSIPKSCVPFPFDQNYVYVEPGVAVLVRFGAFFFVGADASLFFLPTAIHAQGALTVHAQTGVRF